MKKKSVFFRCLFSLIIILFLFFQSLMPNPRAETRKEETESKEPVCLSRALWFRTIKQISDLKDEIVNLRAKVATEEKKSQNREEAHKAILQSERLKCDLQIKAITQKKPCPPPTGCYVALGVTGAVCVGLGIGGYALGRHLPK